MYNKHTNTKVEYQLIIDNKIAISFNTDKKRKEIIKKLKGTRNITSRGNVEYPWNPEEGFHSLLFPSTFAERTGIKDVNRVIRAIKKGKIKTEKLGDDEVIVEKYGYCIIKGVPTNIER